MKLVEGRGVKGIPSLSRRDIIYQLSGESLRIMEIIPFPSWRLSPSPVEMIRVTRGDYLPPSKECFLSGPLASALQLVCNGKDTTRQQSQSYASCALIRIDTINIIFSYYVWRFTGKALSLHPNLHTKK